VGPWWTADIADGRGQSSMNVYLTPGAAEDEVGWEVYGRVIAHSVPVYLTPGAAEDGVGWEVYGRVFAHSVPPCTPPDCLPIVYPRVPPLTVCP